MVVQNGTGHGALLNHLLAFRQSVNAQQVDVLTDLTASGFDSGGSAQSHAVVVAEDDLNVIAVLCQSSGHDFLALGLIPVTNVLNQLLDLHAGVGQSLDGVLSTVLRIGVLGVANDHDVGNNAVAIDVALVVQSQNDLALVGAGLTGVSAHVADSGVVDDAGVGLIAVVAQRLTVDQNQRNAGSHDLVDDDFGRGGLNQVADDDIHALGDEGVNLVGLLAHVVLTVDHGDIVLHSVGLQGLEVSLDLLAVQGHEVIVVLVDGNTNIVGLDIRARLSSGSLRLGGSSSLGLSGLGAATGYQGQGHGQNQQQGNELFHLFSS